MAIRSVISLMIFSLTVTLFFTGKEVPAAKQDKYKVTVENYVLPEVTLINQNGKKVRLNVLLNSKKPVLVDFIFTTCATICPLLSVGFSDFQ